MCQLRVSTKNPISNVQQQLPELLDSYTESCNLFNDQLVNQICKRMLGRNGQTVGEISQLKAD